MQREWRIKVRWRGFPLHPEVPAEGMALSDLFPGGETMIQATRAQLKSAFDAEGLPYDAALARTFNTRQAQELGAWADEQPGGEAVHDALFRAVFEHARNVADMDVLMDVVDACGLDSKDARKALETGRYRDRVDADWALAREGGVKAVPTFVFGGFGVRGAQPLPALERLLEVGGAQRNH